MWRTRHLSPGGNGQLMLGQELFDGRDECGSALFDGGGQGVCITKIDVFDQVALHNGIDP